MFERFTEGAQNVMGRTMAVAEEARSPFVRRHHMLAALLADAGERTEALPALMLADAGVDLGAFKEQVMASLRASEEPRGGEGGRLAYSSGAKKAVELALREALSLGHNYIGCEHLLLAILRSADGPLATTISSTSLNYGTAREFLRNYSPGRERGRRVRGRDIGPLVLRELRRRSHTEAVEQTLDRAFRRVGKGRPVTTGDLLVALAELAPGSHFSRLVEGANLPNPTDLAAAADALVDNVVPDGAPDPVRIDPRTGAMTVTDPELAAKLKDMPGEKIAEALRRLLDDE